MQKGEILNHQYSRQKALNREKFRSHEQRKKRKLFIIGFEALFLGTKT